MDKAEIETMLGKHSEWLNDEPGGKRANLLRADLRYSTLKDADLQDANLQDANFKRANLQDADLRYANLQDANLQDANLKRANLQDANLQDAYLQSANLHGADLRDTDLQGANLKRANLRDTDLQGANLKGADIDYSCWPLWCGSLWVKVCARIARQLAYHFCCLDCDDPAYLKVRNNPDLLDFANGFHRVLSGNCDVLCIIRSDDTTAA